MLSYCERYFKKANQDNSNFVSSASKLPYKFEIRKDKTMSAIENVFEALESVVGTAAAKSKYSFLSPRLFSILPSESDKRKHLLSPSLFSFHENDGFFSLPTLMKKFNFDNKSENEWVETLLEISGASKTLENLVKKMAPEMKTMNERVFPTVLELERMDKNWEKVVSSYSNEQKADISDKGYAFLEPEQLQLVYSGKDKSKLKINLNAYSKLSKDQRQKPIDDDIRRLAKLNPDDDIHRHRQRHRRQIVVHPDNGEVTVGNNTGHHDYSQEVPGDHSSIPHIITLSPWAGGYRIGQGFAFEVVTLSPHAFFGEIMMPAAIGITTLGPRAFIAAILSPNAIISRIISPQAFTAEILSPRALTAYILSPEALVAEVLTPKFLEARVLSPEALIIQVLSPSFLSPRIASPEAGALLILSPSILSPRIKSGHTLTVEILSPHILGGGHSSHEDAEQGIPHQHSVDEIKDPRDANDATQIATLGDHGHGSVPPAAPAAPALPSQQFQHNHNNVPFALPAAPLSFTNPFGVPAAPPQPHFGF
uniref:Uncharacterized protein n=1 Tax=Panagrolaimus superbus TaxID=310955 RepID=A0A914XU98_9BILA